MENDVEMHLRLFRDGATEQETTRHVLKGRRGLPRLQKAPHGASEGLGLTSHARHGTDSPQVRTLHFSNARLLTHSSQRPFRGPLSLSALRLQRGCLKFIPEQEY